jgi:aminopeptidase N
LSEGLAQFAAAEYLKAKFGPRTYAGIVRKFVQWIEKKARFGAVTLGSRLSLLDFEAYQAIVYNKACVALIMLREIIGEKAFSAGLRDFFEKHRFKTARTSNFIKIMESASGRDLSVFFRGWFDSHLLPEVQVRHEVVKQGPGHVLKIRIHQPREVFIFPLVVSWEEGGAKVRRTLLVDAPTKDFEFATGAKPLKFKWNPDKSVPGRFFD